MPQASSRLVALDGLRALAVLLMIQGHTFYALLDKSVKAEPWYRMHERVHGLTAPMFLFASGLAFGVTTFSRWDAHTRIGPAFHQRMRRYGVLLALGYLLQLPGMSLIRPLAKGTLLAPAVLRIGPLHLLALVLALTQLLVLVCRTRERFVVAVSALAASVLVSSPPLVQSGITSSLPLPLAVWIDSRHGSLFPIFPWAAFALLGIVAAHAVVVPQGRGFVAPARLALGTALLALVLSIASKHVWLGGYGPALWTPAASSPFYVLMRLGHVLGIFSVLCAIEAATRAHTRPTPAVLGVLSGRSLIAYVTHLLLLYGTPFTPNLASRIGATLSLAEASAAATVVVGLTLVIAWAWEALHEPRHTVTLHRVQLSLSTVMLYCLFLRA